MSWCQQELEGGILGIFAEAQRYGFARISRDLAVFEARQLERIKRVREANNKLYQQSKRRRNRLSARAKSPYAKLVARERYLRNRPEPKARTVAAPRCTLCGGTVSQSRHETCGVCRFGVSKRVEGDVLRALAEGKSDRVTARELQISRSMVTRIRKRNSTP